MSEIRFDDQVVLVTGAGRGLGRAYASAFAGRGARVVVHDAGVELDGSGGDESVADAVVEEILRADGVATPCYENLVSEGACGRTVDVALERFGRLDVVVHNAGLLVFEGLEEAGRSWEPVRSVGVDAPFHISRAAFPAMKSRQYGRFVFTTSSRAMWPKADVAGMAAYATAKMASFGLMLAVAAEGAEHGILANAVSPVAATRMQQRPTEPGEFDPALVVPGVLYLASDRCEPSGVVLSAAGGSFSTLRWERGRAIEFGRAPVGPEAIAERWNEIEEVSRAA